MIRRLAFFAAAGFVATALAAACSLLASGVTARRWMWAAVGLAVSVGAGLWRAGREAP